MAGVPNWLATDPVEPKLPSRVRPGWAPRPNRQIKIVHGWEVPEGAGQDVPRDSASADYPGRASVAAVAPSAPQPSVQYTPDEPLQITRYQSPAASPSGPSMGQQEDLYASLNTPAPSSVSTDNTSPFDNSSDQDFSNSGSALGSGPQSKAPGDWIDQARQAALDEGIDPDLFARQIQQESGFNPSAKSPAGAIGIAQIMPDTAKAWGVDPTDPRASLKAAARADAQYLKDYGGDYRLMLAAYNAGPAAVAKYGGVPPYDQTQSYVQAIYGSGSSVGAPSSSGRGSGGGRTVVGTAKTALGTNTQRSGLLPTAQTAVGSQYQWGGAGGRNDQATLSPTDCSGFVAWAFQQGAGIKLPAQTQAIWDSTTAIDAAQARPGDLVMYGMDQSSPKLQHVGIYVGNGQMIHDSSINPNGGVDVSPLWSNPSFRRVPGATTEQLQGIQSEDDAGQLQLQRPQQDRVTSWQVIAHGGRQVLMGQYASGKPLVRDLGKTAKPDGTVISQMTPEAQAAAAPASSDQDVGAGQDEGNAASYVPAYADPTDYLNVDWAAASAAALAAQRQGEQLAGYQNVLNAPGMGYQVPTTADVYTARPDLDPLAPKLALSPEQGAPEYTLSTQPAAPEAPPSQPTEFTLAAPPGMQAPGATPPRVALQPPQGTPPAAPTAAEAPPPPDQGAVQQALGTAGAALPSLGMPQGPTSDATQPQTGPGTARQAIQLPQETPSTEPPYAAEPTGGVLQQALATAGETLPDWTSSPAAQLDPTSPVAQIARQGLPTATARQGDIGSLAAAVWEQGISVSQGVASQAANGLAQSYLPKETPQPVVDALATALNPMNLPFGLESIPQMTVGSLMSSAARQAVKDAGGSEQEQAIAAQAGFFVGAARGPNLEEIAQTAARTLDPLTGLPAKLSDATQALRYARQSGQAEVNFALGGLPEVASRLRAARGAAAVEALNQTTAEEARTAAAVGGLGTPNYVYEPGTPEHGISTALYQAAVNDPSGVAHLSSEEMAALPGMPNPNATTVWQRGTPPSLDDLRLAVDNGLNQSHWYSNFAQGARDLVGDQNINEFRTLFGITSQQTAPIDNLAYTLGLMRMAREFTASGTEFTAENIGQWIADNPRLLGDTEGWSAARQQAWLKANPQGQIIDGMRYGGWGVNIDQFEKVADAYNNGIVNVPSNAKTSSYASNILSALHNLYDPNSTMDTWEAQLFNYANPQRVASTDGAYRSMRAVNDHLAGELGMVPHQVQAAGWFSMKAAKDFARTAAAPEDFKQLVKDFESGSATLGDVIRAGQQLGVYDNPGGTWAETINDVRVLDAIDRLKPVLDQPRPPAADNAYLQYPKRTQTGAFPVTPETTAERAIQAVQQAPMLQATLGSDALKALGYDPEAQQFSMLSTVPHIVQASGDQMRVVVPGGNADTLSYVGSLISRAAGIDGFDMHIFRPEGRDLAGWKVVNPDGGALNGLALQQLRDSLDDFKLHYSSLPDGTIRVHAPPGGDSEYEARLADIVDTFGLRVAQVKGVTRRVGASEYESTINRLKGRYDPTGAGGLTTQAADARSGRAGRSGLPVQRGGVAARQAGQVSTQLALRLGGAAAGGLVGYQTAPEGASAEERLGRAAVGALAGGALAYAGERVLSSVEREAAIREALPPEVRDTPHGRAITKQVSAAADPAPYLETLAAAGRLPSQQVLLDLHDPTGSLRPAAFEPALGPSEQASVLQRAALDLNDEQLLRDSKAPPGLKHEPLSPTHLRRAITSAIRRQNPGITVPELMRRADAVLNAAGARQPGFATTQFALRTAGGVAGAAAGGELAARRTPEDDPERTRNILIGAAVGGAFGLGLPYLAGFIGKHALEPAVHAAEEVGINQIARRSDAYAQLHQEFTGGIQTATVAGQLFEDKLTQAFRGQLDAAETSYWELHNSVSPKWQGTPAAVAAFKEWQNHATTAATGDVLAKTIDFSNPANRANLFVPHVLDEDFKNAQKVMPTSDFARATGGYGGLRSNPFWQHAQSRTFQTMDDGVKGVLPDGTTVKPVKYTDNQARSLGLYVAKYKQEQALQQYADGLTKLASKGTFSKDGEPELWLEDTAKKARQQYDAGFSAKRAPGKNASEFRKQGYADQQAGRAKYATYQPPAVAVKSGTPLNAYLPGRLHNVQAGSGLDDVLETLFGKSTGIKPLQAFVQKSLGAVGAVKHNMFGLSGFHGLNVTRQFATSLPGMYAQYGLKGVPVLEHLPGAESTAAKYARFAGELPYTPVRFTQEMTQAVSHVVLPGTWRAFKLREAPGMLEASRDGLMLNMNSQHALSWQRQVGVSLFNAIGGGAAGYTFGQSQNLSQEDSLKLAALGFVGGALTGAHIPGTGASLITHVNDALFSRYIPYLKYRTWQLLKPTIGGRAAAEYANMSLGGQNLMAIARSRTLQDAARFIGLAPDFEEGVAKQWGNALFNWHGPQGAMNRMYWGSALIGSAFMLEAGNQLFSGHWSWDNDPSATLEWDLSGLYDLMGWKHVDQNGQNYRPYFDFMGPWRGQFEALQELARASAMGAMQLYNIQPPVEIAGNVQQGIPHPDPQGAVWRLASARAGLLPRSFIEFGSGTDYAGRSVEVAGDPQYLNVGRRFVNAMQGAMPTGPTQAIKGLETGQQGWGPAIMTSAAGVVGFRTARVKGPPAGQPTDIAHSSTRRLQVLDQWMRDNGVTPEIQQQLQDERVLKSAEVTDKVSALLADPNLTPEVPPGSGKPSSQGLIAQVIAAQQGRIKEYNQLLDRLNLHYGKYDPLSGKPPPAGYEEQKAALDTLFSGVIQGGTDAAADLSDRPDLDPQQLYDMAWQPQSTTGLPQQLLADWGIQAPNWLPNVGAKIDPNDTTALTRERATAVQKVASDWDVDPSVMQDVVKSRLYGNGQLPPLPGMSSAALDEVASKYWEHSQEPSGPDRTKAQQDVLNEAATNYGVDVNNLRDRVIWRGLPLLDQPEALKTYGLATGVDSKTQVYSYANPDGSPWGTLQQEKTATQLLNGARKQGRYSAGKSGYPGTYYTDAAKTTPDAKLNAYAEAQTRGLAAKAIAQQSDPNYQAYNRYYGRGKYLTNEQWQQFQQGTLKGAFADIGDQYPTEFKNRVQLLDKWNQMSPDEKNAADQPQNVRLLLQDPSSGLLSYQYVDMPTAHWYLTNARSTAKLNSATLPDLNPDEAAAGLPGR